jgi:flagellar motor switch protein FliN/FliY
MNTLGDIEVDITVELGAAIMPVHQSAAHGPRRGDRARYRRERPVARLRQQDADRARRQSSVEDGQLRVELTEKVRRSQLQR